MIQPQFKESSLVAGKKPQTVISDGAQNFHDYYKKESYRNVKPRPEHIRHIRLRGDHNNNRMERLNGEIRDREKTMRGLKKMENAILTGYQIFHNYFREHEGLNGRTPAEIAGTRIEGENKWITLIQNASNK
jgi:putative transposase